MSDYGRVETSAEVWAVIKARHPEMRVFSTFSAPDGDPNGNPMQGKMFTSYGFKQGDYPVIRQKPHGILCVMRIAPEQTCNTNTGCAFQCNRTIYMD